MGVINMAHGEFIMMGAYTGYVVQLIVPDYTVSLLIALPLAFAVTFGAGVAMERLVVRHLAGALSPEQIAELNAHIAAQDKASRENGRAAKRRNEPWRARFKTTP